MIRNLHLRKQKSPSVKPVPVSTAFVGFQPEGKDVIHILINADEDPESAIKKVAARLGILHVESGDEGTEVHIAAHDLLTSTTVWHSSYPFREVYYRVSTGIHKFLLEHNDPRLQKPLAEAAAASGIRVVRNDAEAFVFEASRDRAASIAMKYLKQFLSLELAKEDK